MKSHLLPVFVLAAICMVSLGCSDTSVSDPVVHVDESNAEMNKAMETARQTFDKFLDNWDKLPSDNVGVKFGLPTRDGGVEHIWFEPSEITDTEITGTCGNDPAKVAGLKYGDTRTFKRSELTDWMILVGDKCYGGYTIRVLVKMEPENAPPMTFADF